MTPVDIVVTYLNSNDKQWQKDYNTYKEKEIGAKIHKETERQSFGVERIREWDNFRYWFRGVEQNCPWINKVFLVVQNERHIPKWLDRSNPKLRIVYHDEFMPEELLPTFNGLAIQFYVSRIKDLSENYIYSDDDTFFINPTPVEYFFKDGKPVLDVRTEKYKLKYDTDWDKILNTNRKFLHKFMTKENECLYKDSHMQDPYSKSETLKILDDNYDEFLDSFKVSKFRKVGNYQRYLLSDIPKLGQETCMIDRIKNSQYIQMDSKVSLNSYTNKKLICINDTKHLDDFERCRKQVLDFLQYKLPTKSSFELDDIKQDTKQYREANPCFGIVSWLPENNIHRKQRIERLNNTFKQIHDLFGDDANFIVIAQNWKDYEPPEYIKNIQIDKEPKLGILLARKTLRKVFLKSNYDYLIMCDDDIILDTDSNFTKEYFYGELNKHPDGFMFLRVGWSLNFHAISRSVYEKEPFIDVDPQNGEGYEDALWALLLHYKYPKQEFHVFGVKFRQNEGQYHKNHKSTWDGNGINHNKLQALTDYYHERFKKGIFTIDKSIKQQAEIYGKRKEWYENALWHGWVTREEYDEFKKKYGL